MNKLILALALLASLPAYADKATDIYRAGMIAMDQGNVKAASDAFKEVLRLQPGNANARYQLAELQRNQGSVAARARIKKMEEYQLSEINFAKLGLSESLEALTMLIEKKSEEKFSPNFMVQDPSNKLGDAQVTLSVKNVPAKAALDMVLQQAGAVAKYEEHAIVIKPVARTK
ncbi:STN domain-containing protein [Luteolibacter luteus]|jgi:tetratricopeptide (TPR) repeat protein|uniref:Tetratricopeptide repeat protein n=1 Tax=Luteolibacter luteus TaxID=2728835 RepID=A0A858RID0_9BACT|nr:STN domain-containing protein [Luteolibacter luteus]QJE96657.1 tetratricopeptide repeat protein [Luteolibacter luteus]